MLTQEVDRVSIHIDEELAHFSSAPINHCMFRVYDQLRKENEKAYTPEIVAIGPYHHEKDNLQKMGKHKLWYLKLLLKRRNELSADRYVVAMRELEERARKCYAEPISLNEDEFVKMVLLDGCFIIELFRKFMFDDIRDMDPDDPIFQLDPIRHSLRRDLMLLENQLPFFILVKLFNMSKAPNSQVNIIDVALKFLHWILPGPKVLEGASARISVDNVDHLLGLMHNIWCYSFVEMVSQRNVVEQQENLEFIKCTTELHEAGIKFKKAKESTSLFNIKFKNKVIEIPPLQMGDASEIVFRNLIAYEQYRPNSSRYPVTDYVTFMDHLINSAKDVEKLRHYGIIENWLGDDEVVSTIFNKLGNNVWLNDDIFCYQEVYNNVNKHCTRHRNIWMAKLRRDYFNNPWSIISFLAAVMLLLLTFTQAIFSIISYGK